MKSSFDLFITYLTTGGSGREYLVEDYKFMVSFWNVLDGKVLHPELKAIHLLQILSAVVAPQRTS